MVGMVEGRTGIETMESVQVKLLLSTMENLTCTSDWS